MIESDESPGVLFTDGTNRVFLHPPESYPDGHGFRQWIDIQAGPFSGSLQVSSFEPRDALRGFHQQLQALYLDLKGEARLPYSYDDLKIVMMGDGRGHVAVKVKCRKYETDSRTGVPLETRLEFEFCMDQTQLPDILTSVERVFLRD